ncbi:MAG: F-box protein [Chlamydiales bacterium]|nr:F-box protein [Chlamydiales bacterium]
MTVETVTNSEQPSWKELPFVPWMNIVSQLSVPDILNVSEASKGFHSLAQEGPNSERVQDYRHIQDTFSHLETLKVDIHEEFLFVLHGYDEGSEIGLMVADDSILIRLAQLSPEKTIQLIKNCPKFSNNEKLALTAVVISLNSPQKGKELAQDIEGDLRNKALSLIAGAQAKVDLKGAKETALMIQDEAYKSIALLYVFNNALGVDNNVAEEIKELTKDMPEFKEEILLIEMKKGNPKEGAIESFHQGRGDYFSMDIKEYDVNLKAVIEIAKTDSVSQAITQASTIQSRYYQSLAFVEIAKI